ncbi:MAG TPA: phenylalanine--tRNA ligase subunit beta [Thermomicrobiales bacterium]|nr:phenylalanine--tRNA ligase subunit beta [Thermomicrobiales bacterium]
MRVPLKWLDEFVQPGVDASELARRLTLAGLEVEKIDIVGDGWDKVFTAHVNNVERHPDADRLVLADVEAGEHRLTVVTGAPNIAAGQKVVLALAGARLIDGHSDSGEYKTLKPGKIRGITSEGMVCSEKELGMSDEHEGILVLPHDAPVGLPLQQYLGDTVLEFEITPNLAHDFSVLGIAREVGALYHKPLSEPARIDLAGIPAASEELVTIEAPELCARYVAAVINGITIGPSPEWMARRLQQAGVRSINNVVDVTNYVMLEYGQPLHAFDYDRLQGNRIVVRRAEDGEMLETLDHVERTLDSGMLVIADAVRSIALAGVMGGTDTEVSDHTTTVLLEGANFDMKSVRRTSRLLKLRSDASARFERGVDPNLAGTGIARALELFQEVCQGAEIVAVSDVYPAPAQPRSLTMPFDRIEWLIGKAFPKSEVERVLTDLDFQPVISGNQLTVTIPTYRQDVSIPEDIVEEVGRVLGYDQVPATLPVGQTVPVVRDPNYQLQTRLRQVLTASGLSEAVTYITASGTMLSSFATEDNLVGVLTPRPLDSLLKLVNPLNAERPYLRNTLLPALLESVAANLRHQRRVGLFELARVYLPNGRNELPIEVQTLGIVLAGQRDELDRFASNESIDFYDLKGIVDAALHQVGVTGVTYEPTEAPGLHPGRAARILAGDRVIGIIGELHPETAATFGIEAIRVAAGEIDAEALVELSQPQKQAISAPRFLPVEQDLAVVVAESSPAADVEAALRNGAGPLLTGIVLFDEFRGPQIGEENKSLAYRLTFTSPGRALTDDDLIKVRGKIERTLKQVGGRLRV